MYLCFGTFAKAICCCQDDITQDVLIGRLARCILEHSSYISNDCRYSDGWDIKADKSAANKLINCTKDLSKEFTNAAKSCRPDDVIMKLEDGVIPLFAERNQEKIIMVLRDIIQGDAYADTQNQKSFFKYFGKRRKDLILQSEYKFSDFLGRVLLYTSCGDIDNDMGKQSISEITNDYVKRIDSLYTTELQWDEDTQTLRLLFVEMFNIFDAANEKNEVSEFLYKIDPIRDLDYQWVEKCETFINYIRENILLPYSPKMYEPVGFTYQKIMDFYETLNEYIDYVGYNSVPDFHSGWALFNSSGKPGFAKTVDEYRKKLIYIGNDLYHHVLLMEAQPNSGVTQKQGEDGDSENKES